MKFVAVIFIAAFLSSCAWFKSAPVQAVLQPVVHKACEDETKAINAVVASMDSVLHCKSAEVCIKAALGNADICKYSPAALVAEGKVAAKGLVGNIVCPVATAAALGFLSNSIPESCGCELTADVNASAVAAALTAACVAAVPY